MTLTRTGRRVRMATPQMNGQRKTWQTTSGARLVIDGRIICRPGSVTVGNSTHADITVSHEHVSGVHARLTLPPGATEGTVEDLGSTNGTWLRGRRLPANQVVPVRSGDCVLLGRFPVVIAEAARGPTSAVIWNEIIARDPRSLVTLGDIGRTAAFSAPVWIRGESGTGKERVARALHDSGPRSKGPFVALNCAALPTELAEAELFGSERGAFTGAQRRAGAFEQAHGGTLLLDEIAELSPAVQAKLLRVLETGELRRIGGSTTRNVDVRIVCATWRDLTEDAAGGRFRFDLLQRLAVLRLDVLPLRLRAGDIEPLMEHLLTSLNATTLRPSASMCHELRTLGWPGNVRQLRNTVQRAVVSGCWSSALTSIVPPPSTRANSLTDSSRKDFDRTKIAHRAIAGARGNRARAARSLGVSRSTLYRWLAMTG